jgi:hypothetical protein
VSSYYTKKEERTISNFAKVVSVFLVSFFSAWLFGFLGDKIGMSGTYWNWYWFSVISGFLNKLIGFI